ncbi:hypothetical protein [Thauera sp.]|uniref:hypothetical protein n=1 Tax=Thauera sp. TaxID=1905334 RepID=UPI002628BDC7|nr:hypothetical protein [Thauera sp.]
MNAPVGPVPHQSIARDRRRAPPDAHQVIHRRKKAQESRFAALASIPAQWPEVKADTAPVLPDEQRLR